MFHNVLKSFLISIPFYCGIQSVRAFAAGTMNSVCRESSCYPVTRMVVPDDKVSWSIPYPDYVPPNYSAPHLSNSSWADPDIKVKSFKPKWNEDDDGIDRRSYDLDETIKYEVIDGYPLNPKGRTGLSGRGRLGRWGPNHAGDAVVTRWKLINGSKEINPETGSPVLQFIAILRKDCKKWAIPGGFVDPKEASSSAVLRELFEEAIDIKKLSNEALALNEFFKDGKQVYRGYVDDPRNTDNSWIETTAINFHDETDQYTEKLVLDARDDAADAKWVDITEDMDIYPPHYAIIKYLKRSHSFSI